MNPLHKIALQNELDRLKNLPTPEYGEWSCGQSDADAESLEFFISEIQWAIEYIDSPRTTRGDYEFYGIISDIYSNLHAMASESWQLADALLAQENHERRTA